MKTHTNRRSATSYQKSIAQQRTKREAAKLRLAKAKEKEIRRFIKIAQTAGLFEYEYTNQEIGEVFDELVGKKSQQIGDQKYSQSNRNSIG